MNDYSGQAVQRKREEIEPRRHGSGIAIVIVSALIGVTSVMLSLTANSARIQAQVDQQQGASAEIARDAEMVRFVCDDLAVDDEWRNRLHEIDRRYRLTISARQPTALLAVYRERNAAFEWRSKKSTARRIACDSLLLNVSK